MKMNFTCWLFHREGSDQWRQFNVTCFFTWSHNKIVTTDELQLIYNVIISYGWLLQYFSTGFNVVTPHNNSVVHCERCKTIWYSYKSSILMVHGVSMYSYSVIVTLYMHNRKRLFLRHWNWFFDPNHVGACGRGMGGGMWFRGVFRKKCLAGEVNRWRFCKIQPTSLNPGPLLCIYQN